MFISLITFLIILYSILFFVVFFTTIEYAIKENEPFRILLFCFLNPIILTVLIYYYLHEKIYKQNI